MLVDVERVLLEIKREIASKPSHGRDALLAKLAALEVEYSIEADQFESWLRQVSHHFYDSLLGLLPENHEATDPLAGADPRDGAGDGGAPHLRSQRDSEESCQKSRQMIAAGSPLP